MNIEDRFWKNVDTSGDCWLWKLSLNHGGYGVFQVNPKLQVKAHRFAVECTQGQIPEGMQVDHKCHTPACVRPAHLRVVTHKQNMENLSGLARNNTSGVRGVSWHKSTGKWRAEVSHFRKIIHVGLFDSIEAAADAVLAKRNELFTHNDMDRSAA